MQNKGFTEIVKLIPTPITLNLCNIVTNANFEEGVKISFASMISAISIISCISLLERSSIIVNLY